MYICQYTEYAPKNAQICALSLRSMHASIRGTKYESWTVMWIHVGFSEQKVRLQSMLDKSGTGPASLSYWAR